MWHSSDISMESLLDTCEFPAVCPVCGHRGGHIYLRADRPRRGGLWIWYSACCIRNADLSSLVCTQCHGKDTKAFLEGHSLVLECQSCGCRVVGASFYSPCEQDRSLSLKEIMEASRFLKEEGISHDILPAIRYSRYYECGKTLKSLT